MNAEQWGKRLEAARAEANAKRDNARMKQDFAALCEDICTQAGWRELAKVGFAAPGSPHADIADAVNARVKAEGQIARAKAMVEREPPDTPKRQHYAAVATDLPAPILGIAAAESGAILTDGTILMLAGEGGVGKSVIAAQLAHGVASQAGRKDIGGMFVAKRHGPVVYATFEDAPGVSAEQIAWHDRKTNDVQDTKLPVEMLDMNEHPLFGPVDRASGDHGLYNQRPDRLPGWHVLWEAVNDTRPALVVIDAATDAYVGDANAVPPVAAFMADVRRTARKAPWVCGVLLVAHSTKAARNTRGNNKPSFDPFDPGRVAGSAAWTDKARGVMGFMWDGREGAEPGARILAVPKANYGKARVACQPVPVRNEHNRIMGFVAQEWTGKLDELAGDIGDGE